MGSSGWMRGNKSDRGKAMLGNARPGTAVSSRALRSGAREGMARQGKVNRDGLSPGSTPGAVLTGRGGAVRGNVWQSSARPCDAVRGTGLAMQGKP